MGGFDVEAATAAYLAALSPAAHAKAVAYTQGGHWLILWGWVVTVAVALLILRSGLLRRVRDRAGAGGHVKRAVFVTALVYVAVDSLLNLPWTIYSRWWREQDYGLSTQPFAQWFGEWAIATLINLPLVALFVLAVLTLVRRQPRRWWLWSAGVGIAGVAVVLLVSPILIEPIFNTYKPAPAGAVRDRVVALAEATGTPHDKIFIYDGSRQSERYTANVSGLGGAARVAMSDTMFKQNADMAEVIGVVGHEMGHYVRQHVLWLVGFMAVLLLAFFFLTDRLFGVAARAMGEPRARLDDPAMLPVAVTLISTLAVLATPVFSTMTRFTEADADAFSFRWAHEPDGLSKALVKTIAYRASSPSKLEEVLFYDHPSVENRVRAAMQWKAEHPGKAGTPPGDAGE